MLNNGRRDAHGGGYATARGATVGVGQRRNYGILPDLGEKDDGDLAQTKDQSDTYVAEEE